MLNDVVDRHIENLCHRSEYLNPISLLKRVSLYRYLNSVSNLSITYVQEYNFYDVMKGATVVPTVPLSTYRNNRESEEVPSFYDLIKEAPSRLEGLITKIKMSVIHQPDMEVMMGDRLSCMKNMVTYFSARTVSPPSLPSAPSSKASSFVKDISQLA